MKKHFSKMTADEMIEYGYLEVIGKNNEGKEIFKFTDKFFDDNPEVIEKCQTLDSDILTSIWFKDFIDLRMDENGEIHISLTDKSIEWIYSRELNKKEKTMMYDIIKYLIRKV